MRGAYDAEGFIIDASFGAKMNYVLRRRLPNAEIINITVFCETCIRLNRMAHRMNCSSKEAKEELRFRDNFLREVNIEYIMRKSDIQTYNQGRIDYPIREIMKYLKFLKEKGIIKSEKIC